MKKTATSARFRTTADERTFAQEIAKTYPASTDVGEISWPVPTAGMGAAMWVPGTSAHSWQAVAAGGMSIGTKGMMVAAKTLSLTAMDIFKGPAVTRPALDELGRCFCL